jgi:putative transcriptional regulator
MDSKDFDGIVEGLNESIAFVRGDDVRGLKVHIPAEIDVKAIRSKLGLSQAEFADRHGFSPARVRDWEQGRRMPDAGARAFLKVIAAEPEVVERVLAKADMLCDADKAALRHVIPACQNIEEAEGVIDRANAREGYRQLKRKEAVAAAARLYERRKKESV